MVFKDPPDQRGEPVRMVQPVHLALPGFLVQRVQQGVLVWQVVEVSVLQVQRVLPDRQVPTARRDLQVIQDLPVGRGKLVQRVLPDRQV